MGWPAIVATPGRAIAQRAMPDVNALAAAAVPPEALTNVMERMMDPETCCTHSVGAVASEPRLGARRLSNRDWHAANLIEGLHRVGRDHAAA